MMSEFFSSFKNYFVKNVNSLLNDYMGVIQNIVNARMLDISRSYVGQTYNFMGASG